MEPASWQTAKDLFQHALERESSDREHFVRLTCDDPEVREHVLHLLAHHEAGGDFLRSPIVCEPDAQDAQDPLPGRTIGGFLILRRIGVGGIGAVYEAQQETPRRRAAVKVLRPGVFSPL